MHRILTQFISQQSEFQTLLFLNVFALASFLFSITCTEPVCAIGQGVSALCCATEGQKWIFSGYSLTGVSVLSLSQGIFTPTGDMCTTYLIINASLKAVCV